MKNTIIKSQIKDIAQIMSGVYLPIVPNGEIAYLQVKDYLNPNPAKTAARVASTKRTEGNLLKKNDMLFASKGATYLSAIYNEEEPAVASTIFFVIRIANDIILPEYLCWYFNQQSTQSYFKTLQMGSVTPLIHKDSVEELHIPIPNKETQAKIVEASRMVEYEYQLRTQIACKRKRILDKILMNIIK